MNKGFYKNYSTMSPFQFDRIYPNRTTMDNSAKEDGVLIGRYVLIEYNDEDKEQYAKNSETDGGKNYDSTVWQKIYDNEEKYIQIASLDTPMPNVETKIVKASEEPEIEINYTASPETYVFSLPEAWDIKVKTAEDENYSDEYEGGEGTEKRPLNIYYNKKGLKNIDFVKMSKYSPDTFYYQEEDHLTEIDFDELNNYKEQQIFTNAKLSGIDNPVGQDMKVKNDNGDIISTGDTYYQIKLLEDNEYLWDDIIKDSSNFYTLTDPTWLVKGNLTSFSDLDWVVFYYKGFDVEDYTFVNFSENEDRITKIEQLLNEGYSIIYSEFVEITQSDFTYSSNYYDSNFKQIIVIEKQNEKKPYYFKAKEDCQYFIFKKGQVVKDSSDTQTTGRTYFEDEELTVEANLNLGTYMPKIFYRKDKPEGVEGIYEIKDGEYYYLAYEDKPIDEIEYYKKVSYFEKNESLDNKILLENNPVEGIKELSFILPGLGNIAADIYNLFYNDGKEGKSTTIYPSVEYNENLYNIDGEPLYNVYPQSVVGLINTIYDIIGRMKIKDLPDELNDDTIEDSDLINTLFKKDDEYYLVIKRPGIEDINSDTINITLPKGRMKGDINGDGVVDGTYEDVQNDNRAVDTGLLWAKLSGFVELDEIQTWCGNVASEVDSTDVTSTDVMVLIQHIQGTRNIFCDNIGVGINPDYYNNWNYYKIDDLNGYFYKDILVEGMTEGSQAVLHTSVYEDCFIGVDCMEGVARIKAKKLPLEEINCTLGWKPEWVYKAELFNEKSLYHLIAEMQHLVSGSYEEFFNALNKKLWFQTDEHITVTNVVNAEQERIPLSYLIKHNPYFKNKNEEKIELAAELKCENNKVTYKNYFIDEAGHVNNRAPEDKVIYMPMAFTDNTIPKNEDNSINESIIPIGSIWYDT